VPEPQGSPDVPLLEGATHHLLDHPPVYERRREWLAAAA
jgi:hypothetical protein